MENINHSEGSVNECEKMDCKDNGKSASPKNSGFEGQGQKDSQNPPLCFGIWIT